MSKNDFLAIDQQIVGDVYTSSEVMDNLTILTDDFGSRFGGTEGERLAANFIKEKFEAYGLKNVALEPVPYIGWRRGEVKLEIVSPIQKVIDCISLPHSPPANLEATLIDMGDGKPDDFGDRADEIAGKVVLVNSKTFPNGVKRWVHRGEKYGRSVMAGAAGFIFVNHYPAYGPATGGIGHNGEGLIPGISVSYEDGAFLQRLIKRKGEVKIRLTSTDMSEPMTSWNIVGEILGKNADQLVMVGCHVDGHDISQGAQDPASGTVAVIEAARVLAKYAGQMDCTVRFAIWGVEEIGLLGSRQYVADHAAEMPSVRFYLNMDGAGAVESKDIVLNEWADLVPLFAAWQEEMAVDYSIGQSVHAFSDHFPFLLAGVPTGGMQAAAQRTGGRGYGHTRYDTLDKVTIRSLREAAVLGARWLLRLSSVDEWPVVHRTPAEVAALFEGPEYEEDAKYRAEIAAFYEEKRGG